MYGPEGSSPTISVIDESVLELVCTEMNVPAFNYSILLSWAAGLFVYIVEGILVLKSLRLNRPPGSREQSVVKARSGVTVELNEQGIGYY